MTTAREALKGLINDKLNQLQTARTGTNRIGICTQVNSDGSATILVDGQFYTARLLFPIVLGQRAVLMQGGTGDFTAAPTDPAPTPLDPPDHPFFSGQAFRFAGAGGFLGVTVVRLQDAFNSNVYQLDVSDLVTAGFSNYVSHCLSPDATRLGVIYYNSTTHQAHIRVYTIGLTLSSAGAIDQPNKIFKLQATVLLDIVRTDNFNQIHTNTPPFVIPGEIFLTSNAKKMYWSEFNALLTTVTNGDIMTSTHLYQTDQSLVVTDVVPPLATSFLDGAGIGFVTRSLFNVGFLSMVPLDTTNNVDLTYIPQTGGGIWSPDDGLWFAAIEDPQSAFANLAGGLYTASTGPAAAALIQPTGAAYSFNTGGGPVGTVASGGMSIKKQSAGDFWPSASPPSVSGALAQSVSFGKSFRSIAFHNLLNGSTLEDFLRIFYEDGSGNLAEARLTNSLAADSTLWNPFNTNVLTTLIILTSKTGGYLLDGNGGLRKLSSTDAGLTFTADPASAALPISPGTATPKSLRLTQVPLFIFGLKAVSLIP